VTEPDDVTHEKEHGALATRLRRVAEIGVRGLARRAVHRARRSAAAAGREAWRHRYASGAPEAAVLAAALPGVDAARMDTLLVEGPAPWLLDVGDAALPAAFAARYPDALARIVAEADATLRGDWSWIVPGGRADWHAALPGDERWPLAPAGETGIGAAHPIGDVRLNWEMGRCPHLVRLAQAAWCTGDARYARGVVALGLDFAAANPPGRGVAWEHAQEVALRAAAWLWAFHLTRGSGAFDAAARRSWLATLLAHGDYVASHLADGPVTHNHLISEAAGLALLGLALPDLPPAARWRRVGLALLWRELAKQVDDEGVHGEHSTHYHAFVLDSFVAVLLLAARAGVPVPAGARARIGRMLDALALWMREDGTLPAIGDTDAGRAFRLAADPLDRRDLLAAGAIAFGRQDWGAIAGDAPGAFWLGGGRAVPGVGHPSPSGVARRFADAGIGVARNGFGAGAELVVFRCGPNRFRPDVLRAHMHADALSVLWRIGGDDVLVDPGTFLYSEGEGFRVALRRTAAHGCVVVDGRDQADVESQRFGITGERVARWISFEGDGTRLCAAAEHPAGAPLRVTRRVAWCAGGPLVLCDDVTGDAAHRVEAWLVLPPSAGEARACSALLSLANGRSVLVQGFGDVQRIAIARPSAGSAPGPGWIAPRYGIRAPGTALQLDAGTAPLPRRLITVLQTARSADAIAPAQIESAPGGGLRVLAGGRRIRFDGVHGVTIGESS